MENQHYQTNLLNDLLFKKTFASKEMTDVTLHFLREVCGIHAKKVTIKPADVYDISKLANSRIENDILLTKVDLLAELDSGQIVTIELQNSHHRHFIKRVLAYTSKGYLGEYSGEDVIEDNKYETLKPIISVNILNFNYRKGPRPVLWYRIKENEDNTLMVDDWTGEELHQYIYIQLPKINENAPLILQYWLLLFFTGKVPKDAPEHLHKVASFIAFENQNEEERRMLIESQESRNIQAAVMDTRVKEAREEGREIGREEGREEGQEEERREIAINLLTFGMSIRDIAKTTGLPVEEVQQIAKEL